jgi:hypothetical protein
MVAGGGGAARAGLVAALLLSAGCGEPGGPQVGGGQRVAVSSDPPGARILLDGRNTGRRTPDTIGGLRASHDVAVRLDSGGVAYGFLARVAAIADSVPYIHGPLVMRCGTETCWAGTHRTYQTPSFRFAANPVGSLLLRDGRGGGLFWPAGSRNSYVSGSMPVYAAVTDSRDTVALGIYDQRFLAGRPGIASSTNNGTFELLQTAWVLPPVEMLTQRTARGIEIEQHLLGTDVTEDVLLVRIVFRNITKRPSYAAADPIVPGAGFSYDAVFIGFALDPDIGDPRDDWVSYDPALDMVYAYDSDFREATGSYAFEGEARTGPGLVGLRVLRAPQGTRVVLNAWVHGAAAGTGDWSAGFTSERAGWGMLSGAQSYAPSHLGLKVGHMPPAPGDVRLSVSAGPLRLDPGDAAELVIAVILAPPVPGTYSSGVRVEPGDPYRIDRSIHTIAGLLRERAVAAEALLALVQGGGFSASGASAPRAAPPRPAPAPPAAAARTPHPRGTPRPRRRRRPAYRARPQE